MYGSVHKPYLSAQHIFSKFNRIRILFHAFQDQTSVLTTINNDFHCTFHQNSMISKLKIATVERNIFIKGSSNFHTCFAPNTSTIILRKEDICGQFLKQITILLPKPIHFGHQPKVGPYNIIVLTDLTDGKVSVHWTFRIMIPKCSLYSLVCFHLQHGVQIYVQMLQ